MRDAEFPWGKTLRTLSFWALLIVGTIALVQLTSERRSKDIEVLYTRFVNEVDQRNVASVKVTGSRRIRGEFKTAVTVDAQTGNQFATTLPFEPSETWVSALIEKGVDVRGAEEQQSFGVVVLTFLPYVLIFAVVIIMLRQMKGRRERD
jgi:cell division protease FtsH